MRFQAMLLAGLACCAASGENLLSNPGFETVANGEPAHWSLFLMPQAGSEARVDVPGLDSERAASIHHTTTYAQEPVNNWSQCVMGDWAGKTLRLTGHIKTDAAGEAALWLQCWSRSPWMVRGFVSTGIETPLTGSRDWTSVSATIDVPSGTDFLVVRCILLGAGTAWFDGLSLDEIEIETEDTSVPSEAPAETTDEAEAPGEPETVESLRQQNRRFAKELADLRKELAELRSQIAGLAAMSSMSGRAPGESFMPSPLGPRMYGNWEENPR